MVAAGRLDRWPRDSAGESLVPARLRFRRMTRRVPCSTRTSASGRSTDSPLVSRCGQLGAELERPTFLSSGPKSISLPRLNVVTVSYDTDPARADLRSTPSGS